MASRRKGWESLSPGYRKRLESKGITKSLYGRGHNLSSARGHAATPEHGISQARRKPTRYREYLRKHEKISGPPLQTPEEQARELNEAKDAAYLNIKGRLEEYIWYNEQTVLANVYGGDTAESGIVPGMHLAEARWTSSADTEQLRSRASEQYLGNPWWYH